MAIIGISGYSFSGKDEVARMIQDIQPEKEWQVKKFAGKLKTVASILTGIPENKFEDQDFKRTYLKPEWNYWTISIVDNGKFKTQEGRFVTRGEAEEYVGFMKHIYGDFRLEYVVGMKQMTVRQFLQELGTDALRSGLHSNTWVNSLMYEYKTDKGIDILDDGTMNAWFKPLPNWVITDCRFKNEAEAIKERGGIVIRINRPGILPVNNHPSEVALDDWDFDAVISNDGTLNDLFEKVKNTI